MEKKKIKCACCDCYTLESNFDICPVCFWQKDVFQEFNHDDNDAPNSISLKNARINYSKFGAISGEFTTLVRKPTNDEIEDNNGNL